MNPSVASAAITAAVTASVIDSLGTAPVAAGFGAIAALSLGRAEEEKADQAGNAGQYDEPDHLIVHAISAPATGMRAFDEKVS